MRIILYTGKGGVGKTSVAASTAVKSAELGKKTLVVSTDTAHSLGDSLDVELSTEPTLISENLWAQEIDATHEMKGSWEKVQNYLTKLLTSRSVKDITMDELTVFPGAEDLMSLLRILRYYQDDEYDVLVVDCAPTGETLAMLSLPEMLRWWLKKILLLQKKTPKVIRPLAEPLLGIPFLPSDIGREIVNVCNQLTEMKKILSNRDVSSIRLVTNPQKMVVKEAQRSFTYLNMYNYNVDAIVINRIIPDAVSDEYFNVWKDVQKTYIDLTHESFNPVPIYYAPWFEQEVIGIDMLRRMSGGLFGDEDPTEVKYNRRTYEIQKNGAGYAMSVYLPFSDIHSLSLDKKGDELLICSGKAKRTVTLPNTLVGRDVAGAKFEGDTLVIKFLGS